MLVEGLTPDVLWLASRSGNYLVFGTNSKIGLAGYLLTPTFSPNSLKRRLKLALFVSMNTPQFPMIATVWSPPLKAHSSGSQFHAGELIQGAAERREENGYGSTELSCHSCSSLEILPL